MSVAVEIARDHGLRIDQPVPLRSTHNAVAWLAPSDVVAKVTVGVHSGLLMELRVARELAEMDAPVVAPATELPAIVHSRYGLDVTFWRHHPQPAQAGDAAAASIAPALRRLHTALGRISPALRQRIPYFDAELAYVRSLLTNPDSLPALATPDHRLLAGVFERLEAELDVLAPIGEFTVIHGSPHSYNILLVDGEPRFIDFETVCVGPVEWDLAHLDEGAEDHYGHPVHPRLLWVCRAMASVKAATWCWSDVERGDLREHAEWHLSHVRNSIAPLLSVSEEPRSC